MFGIAIAAVAALAAGVLTLVVLLLFAVPMRVAGAPGGVSALPARRARGRSAGERLVPRGYLAWVERKIAHAGRTGSWTVGGFLAIRVVTVVVAVLLGGLIGWMGVRLGFPVVIGVGVVFGLLILVAPEVILSSRADDRQQAIKLALPDTLDQMTIAVEAGLAFDAAMAKAASKGRGPLAQELVRTLQDISIGRSRRDAYAALEQRTDSEDLRKFIRAVVQADEYGIAIADVLRVQAGELRIKRRQRAEESAMKVPVKIVFPLVFCILPVLFIVLLAPAVFGIIQAFAF